MTIAEAIKLYLQSVRRKQTVQEIADGLRAGGLESSAKDFGPTLRSILHNLKKKGDLLRFKDGWDLADAHSASLRNRLAKETAQPKRAKKSKRAAQKARPAKGNGKATAQAISPKGPSMDDRIQAFLQTKPLEWFTAKQVAEGLKETLTTKCVIGLRAACQVWPCRQAGRWPIRRRDEVVTSSFWPALCPILPWRRGTRCRCVLNRSSWSCASPH